MQIWCASKNIQSSPPSNFTKPNKFPSVQTFLLLINMIFIFIYIFLRVIFMGGSSSPIWFVHRSILNKSVEGNSMNNERHFMSIFYIKIFIKSYFFRNCFYFIEWNLEDRSYVELSYFGNVYDIMNFWCLVPNIFRNFIVFAIL